MRITWSMRNMGRWELRQDRAGKEATDTGVSPGRGPAQRCLDLPGSPCPAPDAGPSLSETGASLLGPWNFQDGGRGGVW